MQPSFPHNLLRSWQCPFSNTLVMGGVCVFLGVAKSRNLVDFFSSKSEKKKGGGGFCDAAVHKTIKQNLAIKKYKKKKIQTSFHLVGVWNLMRDLQKIKNKKSFLFQN